MVYTFSGANSYMLQLELARTVDNFLANHSDLGLEKLDGEEVDYERLREACVSLPFLAAKKLVILRTPGAQKEFQENLEDILTGVAETTDVIIVEPKLDKRSKYYKSLQKLTSYKNFEDLDSGELVKWLVAEARRRGGSLSAGDGAYLADRVGFDQQLLSNELDKLLLAETNITRRNIDDLTSRLPGGTAFQLLDAAFAGRTARVLQLYHEQKMQKMEPQALVGLISWQLHVLAIVKAGEGRGQAEIAKQAKLNPFVVGKSMALAKSMTARQIKRLVRDLKKLDQQAKTQNIDLDQVLQSYLLSLTDE